MDTNTNTPRTRKTRTLDERRQALIDQLATIDSKIDGSFVKANQEKTGVKAVAFALRKRNTALHNATILISGRAATAKSPALPGLAEKIKTTQKRLDGQLEAMKRGEEVIANVPFDIKRLEKILEAAEVLGEDPEMPTDLFRLAGDAEKTEAEHEAANVTANDPEIVD